MIRIFSNYSYHFSTWQPSKNLNFFNMFERCIEMNNPIFRIIFFSSSNYSKTVHFNKEYEENFYIIKWSLISGIFMKFVVITRKLKDVDIMLYLRKIHTWWINTFRKFFYLMNCTVQYGFLFVIEKAEHGFLPIEFDIPLISNQVTERIIRSKN